MNNYQLVAAKREWIPEWLYALFVRSFLRRLCARQPLRWLLHEEIDLEEQKP
jgi:hypothetical protein